MLLTLPGQHEQTAYTAGGILTENETYETIPAFDDVPVGGGDYILLSEGVLGIDDGTWKITIAVCSMLSSIHVYTSISRLVRYHDYFKEMMDT